MRRCPYGYPRIWREQRQMLLCDLIAAHPEAVSEFGISLLQAWVSPPTKWPRRVLLPLYKSLLGVPPWPKRGEQPTRHTTKVVAADMWGSETTLPARSLITQCDLRFRADGVMWDLTVKLPYGIRVYTVKTLPVMSPT